MASLPASEAQPLLPPLQLRLAAIVLAFSNFIVVLDMTVANVSVPHIAGSLGVSLNQGSWVITSYSVAEAITVPLTGWLAGRFGSLRMYTVAMGGFGLFSLLCGSSLSLEMMVACRVGQGLCGGLVMPLAQTLLMRIFPGAQRPRGILLATMTTLLGPAFGPNVGGLISDNLSWHWIFFINIPFVAICVFAAFMLLKPIETATRKLPIDYVGLILMLIWVASLQIMLDIGKEHEWFADPLIVALACAAAVGFVAFLIWELTAEHPIVELRVFRYGGFAFGVVAMSLCFSAYFASIVLIPQWLQSSMGFPAVSAGFVTSCTALTALTTSQLASKALARGIDARLLVSCAVAWLGCMALARSTWTSDTDFWTFAMPQLIQGFGMSFFMLPLTTISLGSVPIEETASASGIQNFVRTLSIGVATALALTMQGNAEQEARTEIVGRLQPQDTLTHLTGMGMNQQSAVQTIASLVDRESTTMAVDYVFLITAAVFFLCAAVVWLSPKPRPFGAPAKGR